MPLQKFWAYHQHYFGSSFTSLEGFFERVKAANNLNDLLNFI